MEAPHQIKTIAEYHRLMGLPKPQHPLMSIIRFDDIKSRPHNYPVSIIHDFYSAALKKNFTAKMIYGQHNMDFDEGVMHFMSPGQVLTVKAEKGTEFKHSGWLLLLHPDFFWNTSLAGKIKKYEYFSYHVHEALHLSEKEENLVSDIFEKISQEYHTNIDNYSQEVIIAQAELLLAYAERFYQRQFITRRIINHSVLSGLEELLTAYFAGSDLINKGIPTVQFIAESLHISPNYLSRLLQQLTGQTTKHFVQDRLLNMAKHKLSSSNLSVNEIAFELGFEHVQSFSKFFKTMTKISPSSFRQSFN